MTWPGDLPFARALDRARMRDQQALSFLFHRYLPVVFRYVMSRVGDQHAAEDITSEAFLALIEGIAGARAEDELSFSAWVLGIARNKVLRHFRRLRTHPESRLVAESGRDHADEELLQTTAYEADPLGVVTARESVEEVIAALRHLSHEQQDVVLYRCVLGYSTHDVARFLDKQPAAIRQIQHRALTELARRLGLDATQKSQVEPHPLGAVDPERRTHAP